MFGAGAPQTYTLHSLRCLRGRQKCAQEPQRALVVVLFAGAPPQQSHSWNADRPIPNKLAVVLRTTPSALHLAPAMLAVRAAAGAHRVRAALATHAFGRECHGATVRPARTTPGSPA